MLLAGLALVVTVPLAAACGVADEEEEAPATPTPTAVVEATPTPVPTPAVAAETRPVLPAKVKDKDGKEITVSDVSRIVVLNGDLTEVVFALGLGENVVGVDASATYPPEAQRLPRIGYQRSLNAEGILGLRPTVVIGSELAGPPPVIEQLRSAGVTIVVFNRVDSIEGVSTKINEVATALGVPNRGLLLVEQTEKEIAEALALAAKATTKPRVAMLYMRGPGRTFIGGQGTGAAALIAAAGGIDAGTAAGVRGTMPLTPEALVAGAPDVLLVTTSGLQSVGGIDGLLQTPGIAQTPAGQNRRVVDFDDQYLLGMGPRTGQALMDLVKALHPELRR
jgi:iron complex transport system substrate-binding protein